MPEVNGGKKRTKLRAVLRAISYGAGYGTGGAVAGIFLAGGLNAMGIPIDPVTAGKIAGGVFGGLATLVGLVEDALEG